MPREFPTPLDKLSIERSGYLIEDWELSCVCAQLQYSIHQWDA
jgi:hypothetical protein